MSHYERESSRILKTIQEMIQKADETKDIDELKDAVAMAKLLVAALEHEAYC